MLRTGQRDRWSDADLLTAIAQRDGEASTVFYRRHLPRTLAYLMRETRDPEITADLAAEVFAAVIVAAGRYRAQTPTAAPWVIAIARNLLGASRRRGRVEARARRRLEMEPIEYHDSDLDHTETLAASQAPAVIQLVASLPTGERQAVEAHVVHQQSYSEIATDLQVSEMVVRKRVSRGLGRVRQRLEGN
jgi:RNA polymerase sigma factor (sigma-70 family)